MNQKNIPVEKNENPFQLWNSTLLLLLGGAILLEKNLLQPSFIDAMMVSLFNLLDFRTWPWWYFICLVVVLAFSVRWFLLYQTYVNDDFDPQSWEEAKWFCRLSGMITFILAALVILHRIGAMRRMYHILNYMFGYGSFSIWALLILALVFTLIGLLVFLAGKWITSIQVD